MPAHTEIVVTFQRERHVFENEDSGTRVVIADGAVSEGDSFGQSITLRGEAAEGALKCGLDYRFYGRDVEHPKFGKQFAFTSFTLQEPSGKRAVCVYLMQCPGIGMMTANRLWDKYGDNAVRTLRELPEIAAAEIKGLSANAAEAACEFLQDNYATERSKMDLLGLLQGRGFPKKTIGSLIEDYGASAAERVRHNPYMLMQYRGCGFLGCDKLYMELKKPAGALKRQALCMWHGVAKAGKQSGDTWFSANLARDRLSSEIAGADLKTDRAMELALRGGLLDTRKAMGSLFVAEQRKSRNEERLARYVTEIGCTREEWPDISSLRSLLRGDDGSSHQFDQLTKALRGSLGILTGSPGTGKTYCVAALIRLILSQGWTTDDVLVVAPTGKAAVRITETLQWMGANVQAVTVHTALAVMYEKNTGGWAFQFNERRKLPQKWVFGDEWSMEDTDMCANFFAAIGEGTHVLLSGDTKQLPPVGHGAPLRDMIEAGVPTGTLTEIRRNSGQIVRCCREIKHNKRFVPSAKLDVTTGDNLLHVELEEPDHQIAAITKLIGQTKAGEKYDPVWDVQVVCAVNRKSQVSRHELNRRLQILLNEKGPPAKGTFQVGDKIINTKNTTLKSQFPLQENADKDGCVYVANGEQAEVLEVAPNKIVARLWSPDRTVIIPRGQQDDEPDEKGEGKDGSDEGAEESGSDKPTGTGCSWELGYAISVHKSQGSEWPVVIVVIDDHHSARRVQTSNWLYTGISRAKDFCVTLGKRNVIQAMLGKDAMNRMTFLRERINEYVLVAAKFREKPEPEEWDFTVGHLLGDDLLDGVFGDLGGVLDGVLAGIDTCPF